MMRRAATIGALVLALSGGWPAAAAPASAHSRMTGKARVHAVSGLPVIPLTIRSGARVRSFRVELAQTAEQQSRGLMFRTAMGRDEGMIFPMSPPRYAAFWMHNTVLPLDLLFIAPDGRVLTIAARAQPYSDAQIPSGGIVGAVLELNGGRAASLGIKIGDKVTW